MDVDHGFWCSACGGPIAVDTETGRWVSAASVTFHAPAGSGCSVASGQVGPEIAPSAQPDLAAENAKLRTALETIVRTTKLGGAADIARRALGSEFVK